MTTATRRQRRLPIVVAALSVLAVALVVSTATAKLGDPAPRGNAQPSLKPPTNVAPGGTEKWAARAWDVYAEWAGTPEEQQAAEVVIAHMLNGAFSECVVSRGYQHPWQSSIAPASVYEDPLIYSFWAAGRLDGYYQQKIINAEIGQRQERAANSADVEDAQGEAESSCREQNPAAGDASVTAVRNPDIARKLLSDWSAALAPVFEAGGDIQKYDECITRSGVLSEMGAKDSGEARPVLSTPLPIGTVPLGSEPTTAAWQQYLSEEQAYVEADWQCRAEVRVSLGDKVEQAVDTFVSQHGDEMATARRHWDKSRDEATSLGWSPDDPYAGAGLPARP